MFRLSLLAFTLLVLALIKFAYIDFLLSSRRTLNPGLSNYPQAVSSYYGPGVYWGWFVSCTGLLLRNILKDRKSSGHRSRWYQVDGDLIGSVGYVFFAFVDLCREASVGDSPQLQAAVVVLSSAGTFMIFALTQGFIVRFDVARYDVGNDSNGGLMVIGAYSAWIYSTIYSLAVGFSENIGWIVSSPSLLIVIFLNLPLRFAFVGFIIYVPLLYIIEPDSREILMLLLVVLNFLARWSMTPAAVVPITGSRIGDLDQLSALVVALVVVLRSWANFLISTTWGKRSLRWIRTSMTSANSSNGMELRH